MPGFLSLALEGHVASGRVEAATDEHTLAGAFTRSVVGHLVVQFVRPQHVATLAIKTEINSDEKPIFYVHDNLLFEQILHVVDDVDRCGAHLVLVELLAVQVVHGGDPANVDVGRVLTRENAHAVEILVDKLEALNVVHLVADRLDFGRGH